MSRATPTSPQDEVDALQAEPHPEPAGRSAPSPASWPRRRWREVVYGSSPYAHIAPTPKPRSEARRQDARRLPRHVSGPQQRHPDPDRQAARARRADEDHHRTVRLLAAEAAARAARRWSLPAPKRQIVLVDRPGSVQADIHVGRLAPTRVTPEFFPADGRQQHPRRRHQFAHVPRISARRKASPTTRTASTTPIATPPISRPSPGPQRSDRAGAEGRPRGAGPNGRDARARRGAD